MIASGKRQHNIMRFGKRPAGGHNLLRFGKKDGTRPPQHSFLYFGKRMDDQNSLPDQTSLPDLLQYLQKTNDKSYKRGHTIMRFGKRAEPGYDGEDYYDAYYPDDDDIDEMKRTGHNMMYFGKRGGHSMMYFGKRGGGHNILSFGKRDDDKRAHSMIHFGKREGEDDDDLAIEDKRAHSMIHFGKRENEDYEDPEMDIKRASHSMIHFGKRDIDPELLPYWNPNTYEKKQHNLLRFGKKMDGSRKGSHAMIHFGKRDDDKRAHSMIHFGKRSVDQGNDSSSNNQSENSPSQQGPRVKRDLEDSVRNAEPIVVYGGHEDEDMSPDEDLENDIKSSQPNFYQANEIMDHLAYPDEEQALISFYPGYRPVHKKEASKNVFLRFG